MVVPVPFEFRRVWKLSWKACVDITPETAHALACGMAGIAAGAHSGTCFERALLVMDYARLLRTGGNRREAIRLLRTAHQILSELGAKPFLDACGTELSACGVPIAGAPVPANAHSLTAKEQVVARLVARGLRHADRAHERKGGNIRGSTNVTAPRGKGWWKSALTLRKLLWIHKSNRARTTCGVPGSVRA